MTQVQGRLWIDKVYSGSSGSENTAQKNGHTLNSENGVGNYQVPMRHTPLAKVSNAVVSVLETTFYRIGVFVGKYPLVVILVCITVVGMSCGGFVFFYEEKDPSALWTPKDSQAALDGEWVQKNFGNKTYRPEVILLVADNVLEPEFLLKMLKLDQKIKSISRQEDPSYNWDSICERLGSHCWSNSLLELWAFSRAIIEGLSKEDILNRINSVELHSPLYFNEFDVNNYLGNIERDRNGKIISAKATSMTWMLQYKDNKVEQEKENDWENQFLQICKEMYKESSFQEFHYFAYKSRLDEIDNAIVPDLQLLGVGYAVVMIFAALVLGKFNLLQQRIYVTLAGIMCVGFSTLVAVGLCSYLSLHFSVLHYILPFLLLGIGVDDMFIIAQSLENAETRTKSKDISQSEKIGLTLRHAGVSILLASFTDALAFGIGATTILPALQSFCIYAVVGLLAILIFQTLMFTACLSLDMKRQGDRRDACCICVKHSPDYQPNHCSQVEIIPSFFSQLYASFLVKNPVRITVIVWAIALVAVMAWGAASLRQDSDPNNFYRTDSYAYRFGVANKKYFPGDGYTTAAYIGKIDYFGERESLEELYQDILEDQYTYPGTVSSWHHSFLEWINNKAKTGHFAASRLTDENYKPVNETSFYYLLRLFMCSELKVGSIFTADITFNNPGICTSLNSTIVASRITLKHRNMDSSYEEIEAMESLRQVAEKSKIMDVRIFSPAYVEFERNKVLQHELYRNVGLAFLSITVMTLILIADLWMCLLVCLCVLMTLVDLAGLMYFWGLTIDFVVTIQFILSVGLAVDYVVHIGHAFMTVSGTREERATATLHRMGAAVFYGGFSTFLAFVFLSASACYMFIAFFKVFFGVVLFGLFHGLVFLPSLLSAIGPAPYHSANPGNTSPKQDKNVKRREKHIYTVSTNASAVNSRISIFEVEQAWQVPHWIRTNSLYSTQGRI